MSTTDALKSAIAPAAPAAATAVKKTEVPTTNRGWLCFDKFKKQVALALPKSMTAERMLRVILSECNKAPALFDCSRESFLGAILQCSALGLEPGSALGHCYLIPYGKTCQLIIGYRGMIDLARRSGQIVSLQAWTVHEKDTFNYQLGLDPDIQHIPAASADRGNVTYVYAVARLKGGGVQFEVMSRAEIEKVRKASKAGNSGPWSNHWEEMAKKTVIRRLFKYLPVSIEAVRAVEIDEKTDRGEATTEQDFLDAEFIEKGDMQRRRVHRRRSQRKQLTHHLNKEKIMLKAKSSEIIQSALFDINNQYDNQIDDIDTSLLVESALLIAFESHKSEQKEVLQNIAHSVCNYALTIERAKIESNEISALMFAYDDTEETAERKRGNRRPTRR